MQHLIALAVVLVALAVGWSVGRWLTKRKTEVTMLVAMIILGLTAIVVGLLTHRFEIGMGVGYLVLVAAWGWLLGLACKKTP